MRAIFHCEPPDDIPNTSSTLDMNVIQLQPVRMSALFSSKKSTSWRAPSSRILACRTWCGQWISSHLSNGGQQSSAFPNKARGWWCCCASSFQGALCDPPAGKKSFSWEVWILMWAAAGPARSIFWDFERPAPNVQLNVAWLDQLWCHSPFRFQACTVWMLVFPFNLFKIHPNTSKIHPFNKTMNGRSW